MSTRRKPLTRRGSRRLFSATAVKMHPKNDPPLMRGGYRL